MFMLLLIFTTLFGRYAYADIVNPEMYTKKCMPGEVEVTCKYKSKEPFGETTYDECVSYKEDSDYRFLVGIIYSRFLNF